MTLRGRMALSAVVAAAVAVIAVAIVGVSLTRVKLRREVDHSLRREAADIVSAPRLEQSEADHHGIGPPGIGPRAQFDPGTGAYQVIDSLGQTQLGSAVIPIDDVDLAIAAGTRPGLIRDEHIGGKHYRVATLPASRFRAVQVARPIDDIDRTVRDLGAWFGLIALFGVSLAGVIGVIVARRAIAPVAKLSAAAEDIAAQQDPSMAVPETGGVELAGLGRSINRMLGSLHDVREHERRLIDDAAHELRTPLTSLRTNVEVLVSGQHLGPDDHAALLDDLRNQTEEFANLVGDLDALARQSLSVPDHMEVSMDLVVNAAMRRAARRSTTVRIEANISEPATVNGAPAMLERAVLNVLDNAVKWSPPDGVVHLTLHRNEVVVTDDGPGIAPADLSHVFDRFWRSETARATPGSGLGLAIVKHVMDAHHASVTVGPNTPTGTRVAMTFRPTEA